MVDVTKQPLVISSIAGLWNTYMSDSAAIRKFKHFLSHVDDNETKEILQIALNLSEQHVKYIADIFNQENIPVPDAFGEGDVDVNAPRLFIDAYYLFYLANMSGFGMDAYSLVIRHTARSDIQEFFVKCLNEATDLLQKVTALQLSKGIYLKSPRVEVASKTTYIEKENFLSGIIGEPRPLIAREVANIFAGTLIDIVWRALSVGFGQVTTSKVVKEFLFRGRDITSDHFVKFSEILNKEHIPVSSISDSFVTSSTTSPFSDKLMVFHALSMCDLAIGVDGVAIASSMRSDLLAVHTKFASELIKYASEGVQIMIDNKWLEQPPMVVRHEKLATV